MCNEFFIRGNHVFTKQSKSIKLGLFCSNHVPASLLLELQDLANQWRYRNPIIISGFQSIAEKEVLTVLLRGPQPVIVCPAREIMKMRIKPEWKIPFDEGRLLLVSPFGENVKRPTKKTCFERNLFVASFADQILIAHAHPGSMTERLAMELQEKKKTTYTLRSEFNQNLITLGFEPIT